MRPTESRKPGDLSPASHDNPRGKGGLNAKTHLHSGWSPRARWLFVLVASTAAIAAAKVPAGLRVVGGGGRQLVQETLKTGTTSVPTSRKAICFGKGTGGSGKAVKIKGATALGLLGQAAKSAAALKPLLLTDSFDFGLGICGVGGYSATSKLSWYLKVNHKNPELGGEAVKLKAGDEVLWALEPYPYPNELSLVAPEEATAGVPFEVRVFSYRRQGQAQAGRGRDGDRRPGPDRRRRPHERGARRPDDADRDPRQGHPVQPGAGPLRKREMPRVLIPCAETDARRSRLRYSAWRSRPPVAASARGPT